MTPEVDKRIAVAAEINYSFGISAPIGSRDRANFEQKKESFIAGAKSDAAKNYWQKGMYTQQQVDEMLDRQPCVTTSIMLKKLYTEEYVKELFRKFVIENTNISLIVADNWLSKNKNKEK